MCTVLKMYVHRSGGVSTKNEDVCGWEWRCVYTRMKMYGLECGGMCIQEGRCMCTTVEVCVHKNEGVYAWGWRCVYTRMKIYLHRSEGMCT